jgi:transcriptional regulator with XRE-family HTH domain
MIPKVSQRALADMLQITGLDLDKNAIQRIESGKRFVTDIELLAFASVFGVEIGSLLDDESVSK